MEHRTQKVGEENKESADKMRKKATLDQSIFKNNYLADIIAQTKLYSGKNEEHRKKTHQDDTLRRMHLWAVHVIDFTNFMPEVVLQYAEQLSENNQIAGISNPTLIIQIKSALSSIWSKDKYYEMNFSLCQKMTLEQLKEFKALTNSGTDANVIGAFFQKQFCEELS